MEWVGPFLDAYLWLIVGSIGGLIYRLTRSRPTLRDVAVAVTALLLTIPLAREAVLTLGLEHRDNSQVLIAAVFAVFSEKVLRWVEDELLPTLMPKLRGGRDKGE